MTENKIGEIVRKHGLWLRGEEEGVRADLSKANLSEANLSGVNLSEAALWRANLSGVKLNGANLSRVKLNWQSHDLIAEVLRQAAGNDWQKRGIAGLVLVSRDWCWSKMTALDIPDDLRRWVYASLKPFGVESAPKVAQEAAKEIE
jgi:hypothetical protein